MTYGSNETRFKWRYALVVGVTTTITTFCLNVAGWVEAIRGNWLDALALWGIAWCVPDIGKWHIKSVLRGGWHVIIGGD